MKNTALDFMSEAGQTLEARAIVRDEPDGERSMRRTGEALSELTGREFSEREGWLLLLLLKISRANAGHYHRDDYLDAIGYAALLAESSDRENREGSP